MASEPQHSQTLYQTAFRLSLFTILFSIAEGLVSIFFGYKDGSLTLFGFGVDSFIEVISALGIAHMVVQTQRDPGNDDYRFERRALRITGSSFYALAIGLTASSIYNLVIGQKPETTFAGVIVSVVSIITMLVLKRAKAKIGTELKSAAVLADAECTQVCIYMSLVLLAASGLYELTNIPYADVVGSLALAYLSVKEGRECFERAKSDTPYVCDVD
ncbi:MAG: cation transporter [Bacteroidota bacterium]|nr:cation transporter [Bacteroidota bacterium]